MSPELGVGKARGEVTEHHHRRKERHDPWIAQPEGGDPATVGEDRPDKIGELGTFEAGGLGVRLVLQQAGVDRLAPRADLGQVVEPAADIEIVGVVDRRLGSAGRGPPSGTA